MIGGPGSATRASAVLGLAIAVVGAGCHRNAAPGATVAAADGAAPARRPVVRHEAPFSHPLLAGATTEITHEDCSSRALVAVVGRAQAIGARSKPGAGGGCPSPAAEETARIVRGELLTRVGACVARDGPLDAEWDMVNSAVLSLGVCLDCRRPRDDQTAQCRRSGEVLARIAKTRR